LPEVLHSLNESLKWEDELASQTKKMIAYPAFVGTIVLAPPFPDGLHGAAAQAVR
jgi:type IV pilus assembly protein PilC